MTDRDFERVKSMLKSVYPRIEYLDNRDTALVFFNMLNKYDFADVWKGVKNCVEVERYAPVMSTIEQYVRDAEKNRRDAIRAANPIDRDSMAVRCTKCNDAGFLWVKYKNGTETARPCICETSREQNPWAFMSDEEYEQAHEQQRKHGQQPPQGKPGHDSNWWREQCGEAVSITPGRRVPGMKATR